MGTRESQAERPAFRAASCAAYGAAFSVVAMWCQAGWRWLAVRWGWIEEPAESESLGLFGLLLGTLPAALLGALLGLFVGFVASIAVRRSRAAT